MGVRSNWDKWRDAKLSWQFHTEFDNARSAYARDGIAALERYLRRWP